jgi:glycine betaine/proline transport system ATP-binding protein
MVSARKLKEVVESGGALEDAYIDNVSPVGCDEYLQDVLGKITDSEYPAPVVDENNVYQGAISRRRFLKTLVKTEAE